MADVPTNGGGFTRAYCSKCEKIQPISKELLSDEAMDLVCEVCHSVIATLFKEGFAASAGA
jgi:hypothetical protein